MKTSVVLFLAMSVTIWACNNEAKDSVEQADSANKANLDSPSVTQPIAADEETSSFMVKAADGGMAEVQLGRMASEKGTNQKVKDFGAMMARDHSMANDELKRLAAQRHVVLPGDISEENKKKASDLAKKTGGDFDKAYVKTMVNEHQATIDLFEKSAGKVNDTEVKSFIDNTLPKVRQHLDSIKAIQKSLR